MVDTDVPEVVGTPEPDTGTLKPSVTDEEATRRCGYCGEEFSYQRTANRPPKYCSRVWPEPPRTCQARAKAQRVAQKAVGLDGSVAAYRQAGEVVLPAITTLQETLAGLLAETHRVETAALARIADAERDVQDAAHRVEAADDARERAERAQGNAERAAAEATRGARDAERRAQQAEQERDTKLQQAWEQLTHKEGERAAAVARAEEQADAARRAEQQWQSERARAEKLTAANDELQQRLTEARTQAEQHLAKAHADVTAVRDQLVQAQARHVQQLDRLRDHAAAEATQLRTERDAAQETVSGLRTELTSAQRRIEALSEQVQATKAAAQAAAERAEIADKRYEQLLKALSAPKAVSDPGSGRPSP